MSNDHVTIDDVKALSLSHKNKLDRKKALNISPLPSLNVSVKNQAPISNSNGFHGTPSPNDSQFASMTIQMGNMNLDVSHNYCIIQRSSQYQGNLMNSEN